jgi:hypothetical protein
LGHGEEVRIIEIMLAAWMAQTSHNKLLLILDNCGPRNVVAMLATFEAVNHQIVFSAQCLAG